MLSIALIVTVIDLRLSMLSTALLLVNIVSTHALICESLL